MIDKSKKQIGIFKRVRFVMFYSFFMVALLIISACHKDENNLNPSNGKIVTGTFTTLTNVSVGNGGGKVNVTSGVLNGMTIEIPPGSYPSNKDFTISSADIISHTFGPDFNPITPVIRINNGGGYADSILTVTIPCVVPKDHFAMGFYYDEETGELEGIPVLAIHDSSIVLATRHFSGKHLNEGVGSLTIRAKVWADVIVSSMDINELYRHDADSDFKPGIDDWEFKNYGSYIAPLGHCAGQAITAMWYYGVHKLGLNEKKLYERFSTFPGALWQDNRNGYRFASVIQAIYAQKNDQSYFFTKFFESNISKLPYNLLTYLGFTYSIRLTKKPQYVGVSNDFDHSHAMIVYAANTGFLWVADPNFPTQRTKKIEYIPSKYDFNPYASKLNAAEPDEFYNHIYYYAKSAIISSQGIAEQYDKMLKGTIGDDPPYQFPRYQLIYYDGKEWQDLPTNFNTEVDTMTVAVRCFQCVNRYPGDLTFFHLVDINGDNTKQSNDQGYMTLKFGFGSTKLGFVIYGRPDLNKNDLRYIDFLIDTFNVTFGPLAISPNPINSAPDKEIELSAKSTSTPPNDTKYVWNFGDGSTEVIKNNDNTVKHKFSKVGDYNVNVKLYDNATSNLLGSATAIAKITISTAKTFSYNWLERKSTRDWLYDINFNLSGTLEEKNKNTVEEIKGDENNKIVSIKFANIDSFKINFNSSFSLSSNQIVSTLDPNEILTFKGSPRISWSTSNFVPGASQNVGSGIFENDKCQGTITIKGSIDYQSVYFDDNVNKYVTYNGVFDWVLGYIDFDKY